MTTALRPRKLTYEDYLRFPEDGKRHELIDGEHYVTAAPNTRHQTVLLNLVGVLLPFVRRSRLGKLMIAPFDVVLSDFDVVEPDLLFLSSARSDLLTQANLQGAPDLAVEVLSPSTRRTDENAKRHLYERRGVAEYWLVDPEAETVKVWRWTGPVPGEGPFERVAELSLESADALASPLFPGLVVPLAAVFED